MNVTGGPLDKAAEHDESKGVWKTVKTKMVEKKNLVLLFVVNLTNKIIDNWFNFLLLFYS